MTLIARVSLMTLLVGLLTGSVVGAAPPRNLDVAADVAEVATLAQHWTDDEARRFYSTPQGSKLLPYRWFLHLEQPDSAQPFRHPDHVRRLGYLPRTSDSGHNPDGLPVGFTKDEDHLGLTCAACHTTQINYAGKGVLVDGAPALADFEGFLRKLVEALTATHADDAKFGRFAAGVLGAGVDPTATARLRADLKAERDRRAGYNARNLPVTGATPFGPGRVDAFGAILNEVAVTHAQVPDNAAPADAPVSYPALWDAPHHDFVQWNGSAENKVTTNPLLRKLVGTPHLGALGRNSGEVLGVFGAVDATNEGSLLTLKGYPSSVNRANLIALEDSLRGLWSPLWPDQLLPPIQSAKRDAGAVLYRANCQSCHEPIVRDADNRTVEAKMAAVGTDPVMATNFMIRTAKTGRLKARVVELLAIPPRRFGDHAPAGLMLRHLVQRTVLRPDADTLTLTVTEKAKLGLALGELEAHVDFRVVGEVKPDGVTQLLGRYSFAAGPAAAPPAVEVAYKGRPLNGIWATAPYLHNGSVPTLDELLKPSAQRSQAVFKVGDREYDPVKVGFVTATTTGKDFNPADRGNSNRGHDFGRHADGPRKGQVFSDDERAQLVEYLKSL